MFWLIIAVACLAALMWSEWMRSYHHKRNMRMSYDFIEYDYEQTLEHLYPVYYDTTIFHDPARN